MGTLGKPFNTGYLDFYCLLTLPLSLGSDLSQADRNCLVVKSDSWKDINFKDTLVHGRRTSQVHNPQTWKTPQAVRT